MLTHPGKLLENIDAWPIPRPDECSSLSWDLDITVFKFSSVIEHTASVENPQVLSRWDQD